MALLRHSITGRGDALLVLLHGLTGDRSSVLRYAPGGGVAVLAIDLPGHGASQPAGEFTLPAVTQAVAAVVETVRPAYREVHVGGVSLGASVAAELAAQQGAAIRSAVLVRPTHTGTPNPPHLALNLIIADLLEDDPTTAAARLEGLPEFQRLRLESPSAAGNLRRKALPARPAAARRRASLLRVGTGWAGPRLTATTDALVLSAADDGLHPEHVADAWVSALAGGTRARLPPPDDASHAAVARALIGAHVDAHRRTW